MPTKLSDHPLLSAKSVTEMIDKIIPQTKNNTVFSGDEFVRNSKLGNRIRSVERSLTNESKISTINIEQLKEAVNEFGNVVGVFVSGTFTGQLAVTDSDGNFAPLDFKNHHKYSGWRFRTVGLSSVLASVQAIDGQGGVEVCKIAMSGSVQGYRDENKLDQVIELMGEDEGTRR